MDLSKLHSTVSGTDELLRVAERMLEVQSENGRTEKALAAALTILRMARVDLRKIAVTVWIEYDRELMGDTKRGRRTASSN